jgi:hypothetical protein
MRRRGHQQVCRLGVRLASLPALSTAPETIPPLNLGAVGAGSGMSPPPSPFSATPSATPQTAPQPEEVPTPFFHLPHPPSPTPQPEPDRTQAPIVGSLLSRDTATSQKEGRLRRIRFLCFPPHRHLHRCRLLLWPPPPWKVPPLARLLALQRRPLRSQRLHFLRNHLQIQLLPNPNPAPLRPLFRLLHRRRFQQHLRRLRPAIPA